MIIGVVIAHVPPYEYITDLTFAFTDVLKAFFAHAFFKASVPILAALSGYLLFISTLYLDIPKLILKKTKTLILPLIIWNIPFVTIVVMLQYYGSYTLQADYILYPFSLENWLSGLLAIFGEPFNGPLYFLRDLFVIAVIAPFYWMIFKKIPYIGLLAIIAIFAFELDGHLVLRDSMYVTYYLGILAATQKWDLKKLDKYAYPLFAVFIMFCIYITYNKRGNSDVLGIVAPFFIWPALSIITYTRLGDFLVKNTKYSFLLFLTHIPIMFIFYQLYTLLDYNIPYLIFWLVAPIITTFIVIKIIPRTEPLFPSLYRISTGGR
jgi:succinoglycan biosynthesis protein ExoH